MEERPEQIKNTATAGRCQTILSSIYVSGLVAIFIFAEPASSEQTSPNALPTPSPTVTPAPSATPAPTVTPAPSATPAPTITRAPSATPAPTITRAPSATPATAAADLKNIRDIVDIVFKSITASATIVGGAWAYYHFIKGRVFKPRLTLSTSARRLQAKGTEYVLSTIKLSNVGLSRVEIASADIRVCSLSSPAVAGAVSFPKLTRLKTVNVLLAHNSVKSGETLKEQNILALASNRDHPILLDLRVVAKGVSFTARTIAEPSDQADATYPPFWIGANNGT